MSETPKVSIVTICFNQAEFLERAIESVLDQDYPNIEHIIVDPGSTDDSRDIIERYRDKFATVILDPDDGPADGLNKGFAAATGEVFGCLNSDDIYLPGAVRAAVDALAARPGADVVYANGVIIDVGDGVVRRMRSDPYNLWRYLYGGVMVLHQATFCRRDAFFRVNGFNKENRTSWDGELLVDIVLAGGRLDYVDEEWGGFRIYEESITGSGRIVEAFRKDLVRMRARAGYTSNPVLVGVYRVLARVWKWGLNPKVVLFRLWDRVVGSPKIVRDR